MSPAPVCGMPCSPTRMMPRLLCYSAAVLHTSASVLQQVRRGLPLWWRVEFLPGTKWYCPSPQLHRAGSTADEELVDVQSRIVLCRMYLLPWPTYARRRGHDNGSTVT
jgi:hypothetical protein